MAYSSVFGGGRRIMGRGLGGLGFSAAASIPAASVLDCSGSGASFPVGGAGTAAGATGSWDVPGAASDAGIAGSCAAGTAGVDGAAAPGLLMTGRGLGGFGAEASGAGLSFSAGAGTT